MSIDDKWSESFFDGPWVPFHLNMRTDEDIQGDCDAITSLLGLAEGSSVFDVPCGTGDHAIELAKRGWSMTGVDRSEELLGHARRRAAEAGVDVNWVPDDMRELATVSGANALICMWGSFGYFRDEEDRKQLEAFFRALGSGGQVLLDVLPLEGLLPRFQPKDWQEIGGVMITQRRHYDPVGQRIEAKWTFVLDGVTTQRASSMRLYTYREALQLLESVGFVDVQGFDPETRLPFELGSTRAWMRGRKP